MKKLNNKGYMLVEIILAFVLAIGITYFVTELIIKLKNKNDDLLVKTLVSTDQTIIYNTIMKDINNGTFSCDNIVIDDNKFIYEGKVIVDVSEYASVENMTCEVKNEETTLHIPIIVKQMTDEDFDVKIGLGDGVEGNSTLSCELELTSDNVVRLAKDVSFEGMIIYQGFDENYEGDNTTSKTISSTGTYTYYIKAMSKSGEVVSSCNIDIALKDVKVYTCSSGYNLSGTKCYKTTYSPASSTSIYTCSSNSLSYASASSCSSKCTGTCSVTTKYSCSEGSPNGAYCEKTTSISASFSHYKCPGGYSDVANNDTYCWKTVE